MITLRSYQTPHCEKLLTVLRERRVAQDGSDMGVGKSYVAAKIAAEFNVATTVICPLSVAPTWETILTDAGVRNFTVWNYEKARTKLFDKIPWGKGSYLKPKQRMPFIIFDEDHRCQSRTTLQGKMLIAARRAQALGEDRILGLSATVADSPLKLGPLGFALGLHALNDFDSWLDRHGCPEITMGPKDRPEDQWKERIFLKREQDRVTALLNHEIYELRGSRLRIADIPDFPKTQIDVRLLDGHEKEVQRLSAELKAFHDNRKQRSEMSDDDRAKLVFLRQAMEVAKVPALCDMILDALETSKVAVFCNYSTTLDALAAWCSTKNIKSGFIRGDQRPEERADTIARFQSNRLDVTLANIQAGGVGVSLHDPVTKVPRTSLICPTFSAVDLRQATGRVHRDGGGTSIQHLVYFRGTVEERVAKSVQAKLDRLDLLNDGELETGQSEMQLA